MSDYVDLRELRRDYRKNRKKKNNASTGNDIKYLLSEAYYCTDNLNMFLDSTINSKRDYKISKEDLSIAKQLLPLVINLYDYLNTIISYNKQK